MRQREQQHPRPRGVPEPQANAWAPVAPPHPESVLTPAQTAEWLGLKRRQLQRAGVPHVRVSHKVRLYRAMDVYKWLDQRVERPNVA